MHKRINNSTSLFDDNDDDEDDNFGRSSNRFRKIKDRPKDDFQRELEKKVSLNRTITPRSIDTDSELGEDNQEDSFKSSDNSKNQKSTMGGSGWQPDSKSPRVSFLRNEESKTSNLPSERSNPKSKPSNLLKQKSIVDENSDEFEFSKQSNSRFSKSHRDEKNDSGKIFSLNDTNLNQGEEKKKFSKNSFSEKSNDKYNDSDSFNKTIRIKDSENVSQIFDDINKKTNKNEKFLKTHKGFGINDEEDSVNVTPSRFLKTKTHENESNKSEYNSIYNKSNKSKVDDDNYPFSETSKSKRDKSDSFELEGSSKFILNDTKNKFNVLNDLDMELSNSTRYMKIDQENNEKFKSDIKPKPRKSHIRNSEVENELPSMKNNKDEQKSRRSIRFEDECFEPFTKNSKDFSRESSPRKSDVSRQSSQRNSPSPQTSICEEVVQDPWTLKNETTKKKLEEEKRKEESKFESPHNKLLNHGINSVADCQNEVEPKQPSTSLKKTTSRPTSAKYRNVQPKVTTRINLKSARPLLTNNEWSSSPNLNSDSDNINSERNFTDSQTIRETAYLQWYLAKLSEKNIKKPVDNNEEKNKKGSEDERLAAYEAWKKAKHDYFIELDKKRKEEKKKTEKSETPENKENKSAEIAFEVWKKQKEEILKEEIKMKAKDENKKKLQCRKDQQEKDIKRTDSINEWKQRKAKEEHEKKLQVHKEEEEKTQKENEIKNKLVVAEKAYKEWEEKTEIKIKKYCEFEKNKATLINNRRAWRPSNNAIIKNRRI